MADAQANIGIGVDISEGLAAIRQLQREISAFHTSMAKGGALANAESMRLSQNLINTINASGQFSAGMTRISSSTESFTNALEKNKLSMSQYFRYAGGASRSFGKMFSREFNTVNRVAQERVKDLQTQYISMGRDANGALQAIKVRPLALDMNDLGTKVQMVAQKQQIFNQLLKQGSTNLLNFGKNTQWAGRQLMVGFTIPLTIFGATAAREFQKLEEQAVKFRRVYGDMFTTDAETEQALANIRELADEFTKYGIAVEKTVGLAAKVAQMGNVGSDLTAQVTQATRLAVLGGLEQEEALDTTISLTNAFGIAAEDLAGKIAFLNAAENQTILAIEDFNEAIPKAGSVVQQLGGDVEDLAFMLTAMREGGINASQAANAIKSSLGRMINPTAAATEKLRGFGIDIVGIVESNVGDLNATVTQLGYALDGLDPLNRARAIETLFGKFQFARMSTMFSNIVKEGSQANRVLQLTTNSTEELAIIAERELKRVEESPAFKLQKEMEKLKAALAPIGAEFIKAVTPIVQFGTKILKAFNEMGDGGKQFIVILTAVAGVVAPAALMAFGLIANGVANLIKFFALLGRGFMSLSGSSKVLGTGTEYLTQQQIEAAAVAASLGQSHSNLIQVFSAEAAAVNNLTAAYRQSIIAQGAFKGTGAAASARVPKPKGYAKGGLIVGPGSGTSDSIAAMVSNGEYIVNAERTKQYLPLLEAIAKGEVPGYRTPQGGQVVGASPGESVAIPTSGVRQIVLKLMGIKDEASMTDTQRNKAAKLETEITRETEKSIQSLGLTAKEAIQRIEEGLSQTSAPNVTALRDDPAFKALKEERVDAQGDVFAHIGSGKKVKSSTAAKGIAPDDDSAAARLIRDTSAVLPDREVAFKHSWGMTTSRSGNLKLANQGWEKDDALADYDSRGASKWDRAFAAGGADSNDPDVQFLKAEQDKRLREKMANSGATHFVDTQAEIDALRNQGTDTSTYAVIADLEQEVFDEMQQDQNILEQQRQKHAAIRDQAKSRVKEVRSHKYTNEDLETIDRVAADSSDPQRQQAAQRLGQQLGISRDEDGTITSSKRNISQEVTKKSRGKSAVLSDETPVDFGSEAEVDETQLQKVQQEMYKLGEAGGDGLAEGTRVSLDSNSPSRRMFDLGKDAADGLANGFEAGMADEAPNPLAPPKPPEVGYMPDDTSLRGKLRMVKEDAIKKFNDSAPGQYLGKKVSKLSGTALTDSEGNITYDPNTDPDAWASQISDGAPMPVRVVDGFEIDPEFQETMERGTANTEDLNKQIGQQVDAVEENTGTVQRTAEEQKEIDKTNKRQNRGALAGKMLAGLGSVTMAAGMATQVEGVVGQTAQQLVGPLAAITGILPTLTAMGPLWGTLLGVIGAGVALWMRHNAAVNKARKEAYDLARAMGAGRDAIQKFADFSGRVTSGEIAARQRANRQSPLQLQPGQKTFGSAFIEDEAGQAMVENTRRALQKLGEDSTIQSLYTQLGTAVTQGALSTEEAISIAAALSQELGDYSIGMQVNAKLIELLGPNGENVLTEPLKIETQAKLMEDTLEASAETLTRSFQTIEALSTPAASTQYDPTMSGYQSVYVGAGQGVTSINPTDPVGQALVEAETERRSQDAGWWERTFVIPWDRATGKIADELRAEAIGSSMGIFANNLEQSAQAIDAQRMSTQTLIDEAIKNGASEADIAALKEQEAQAIDTLMESLATANEQLFEWWDGLPKADRVATRNDQEERIRAAAEEKGLDPTQVGADLVRLRADTDDVEGMRVNMIIRSAVESGALNENQLTSIVDNFNNPEEKKLISDLILGIGPGETGNLLNFLNQIDNEELQTDILLGFKDADTENALERVSDLDNLFRTSPIFDGVDIPINFFTTGEGDLEETLNVADEVRNLAAQGGLFGEDGNIDMEAYAGVVGEDVAARAAEAADSIGAEFDALDEAGKLEFFTNFAINAQFTGDPAAIAFYKSKAQEMGLQLDFGTTGSGQEQAAADRVLGEQIINYIPTTRAVNAPGDGDGEDDGGGGGGKEAFDDLLVGLRNVRQATIDMKRGWDGMQESLQKFLDSGATGFNGLSNQMRRFGVGESLIERIVGMDPDEYEKRKGELFTFDEAGNITGTTQKLQNMGAAMNKLALGEYVNSQQSFIENTKNQFTAMQMLTAQGLSFVEAYEMVQDQALATAIAMGATREEIEELIRITEQLTQMQEKYNKLSEKEQAAKAVKESNKEFQKRVNILSKLSKEQGKYSDEEIDAILNDPNLGTLFLNPKIDPKTLKQALENARKAADLELSIKVSTEEGKEGLFNELVAEVQDEFNRQEAKIDIDFRLANKADQDIVNEAQNRIAAIQYAIDDYEAQLRGIEDQEQVINEKYDDRYKALEEVAAANERINRLKAAELDVADALSRGDIAAAARAQQELRATEAQNRAESEKEMLQRQQEAELARVRSESGMSREDLEKKIKALQDEIFGIEETSLEPAQERIRLAEVQKQAQIDALDVSGKTRDEWDQIANLTDIARQNTDEFAKSVERALALYEYFVNGADLPLDLFGGELLQQVKSLGVDVDKEIEKQVAKVAASNPAPAPQGGDTKAEPKPNVALGEFARDALKNLVTSGTTDSLTTLQKAVLGMMPKEEAQKVIQTSASSALRNLTSGGTLSVAEKALLGLDRDYKTGAELRAPTPNYSGASSTQRHSSSSSTGSTWTSNPSQGGGATQRSTPVYTTNPSLGGGAVKKSVSQMTTAERRAIGLPYSSGGIIKPMRFSVGGRVMGYAAGGYGFGVSGSDNIPAILTPGEFVVRKRAVQDFGMKNLEKINNGEYSGGSVYNYSLAVNVKSDADPNKIAKTVMREIKRVDSQRVRGNRF